MFTDPGVFVTIAAVASIAAGLGWQAARQQSEDAWDAHVEQALEQARARHPSARRR